jgi:hypothetical protein
MRYDFAITGRALDYYIQNKKMEVCHSSLSLCLSVVYCDPINAHTSAAGRPV